MGTRDRWSEYDAETEGDSTTFLQVEQHPASTASDRRMSVYMNDELMQLLTRQVKQDTTNKNTFVTRLLHLLLISPIGRNLQIAAQRNGRTLLEELRSFLALLDKYVPMDEVNQLAEESHRTPEQMMTYLLLVGLKVYKKKKQKDEID